MKKRLSLLMVLMMVLSLVPMSVFAATGTATAGRIEVGDNDTKVEEITFKLSQAANTYLNGGKARITLNKGEFAVDANAVDFAELATGGVAYKEKNNLYGYAQRAAFNTGEENIVVPAENAGTITTVFTTYDTAAPAGQAVLNTVRNVSGNQYSGNFEVTLDQADKSVAYVEFPAIEVGSKGMDIIFNMYVLFDEESAGDITVKVDSVGSDKDGLEVSSPIKIGTVVEGKAKDLRIVAADATKKIGLEGGVLSKVEIKNIKDEKADKVVMELPYYLSWDKAQVISVDGIAVTVDGPAVNNMTAKLSSTDEKYAQDNVIIVEGLSANSIQRATILVEPSVTVTRREASMGDITLKAISYQGTKKLTTTSEIIGAVTGYDVTMAAREKDKKEIPALFGGETAKVRVKLSGVVGSFTSKRVIDFTVDGADVVTGSIKNVSNFKTDSADYKIDELGFVKNGEFSLTNADNASEKKSLEFEMEIKVDYSKEGAVVLKADARDFGKVECEVAKVTPAYTVTFDKVTPIKKGESLATADVTIKEGKAGMFESADYVIVHLNGHSTDKLSFSKDFKYEATNGLKIEDELTRRGHNRKYDASTLVFDVRSSSTKEAGQIKLSNLVVNVDGGAVDGKKTIDTYLVEDAKHLDVILNSLTNSANRVVTYRDADYSKDYVEVVKEYGTIAQTTVFKIGSKEYTVNGETKTANEAPYISGKGFTMLPVRAVGESLGLKADWNAQTKMATFTNGTIVASVTIGSDTMYVGGTPIKLAAKAEIKNGSTFVELRGLARAFGADLEWDAATKSVTIKG